MGVGGRSMCAARGQREPGRVGGRSPAAPSKLQNRSLETQFTHLSTSLIGFLQVARGSAGPRRVLSHDKPVASEPVSSVTVTVSQVGNLEWQGHVPWD